jgi:hypothetical protein
MPRRAQSAEPAPTQEIKPGSDASFAPLNLVEAGVLKVGYAEAGPADGAPVILPRGWPYDIHSYAEVAPLLASAGFRAIVPYLRGSAAGALVTNSARWLSAARDEPPIASRRHENVGLIAFAGRARRGRGSQRIAFPTLKARGRRPGRPR